MRRDGEDTVLRLLGEAIMLLALGLGQVKGNGSGGCAHQKQVRRSTR